jgi:hypothetical protein
MSVGFGGCRPPLQGEQESARSKSIQFDRAAKEPFFSTGPLDEGVLLGEDALAFSTFCQNLSELGGGCFRINSSRDLASAFIIGFCVEHRAGSNCF